MKYEKMIQGLQEAQAIVKGEVKEANVEKTRKPALEALTKAIDHFLALAKMI